MPSENQRIGPASGNLTKQWRIAGDALRKTFDHVWVLTLRGQSERIRHMRGLLEDNLHIPSSQISYFEGAAGSDWGHWPALEALQRRRTLRSNWWLSPELCASNGTDRGLGGIGPPPCLQPRYRRCLVPAQGLLPRFCNELCYTLSVVAALEDFLRTPHSKALLLEDDICGTHALLSSSTLHALSWMRKHPDEWDAVKLAGM